MQTFFAVTNENDEFVVCRTKDEAIVAKCVTEDWSCAICDALNMVDRIAEQAIEMGTWPK